MTRLTKGVREQVAHAMIKAKFEQALDPLAAQSADLFTRVYEAAYDEQTRKLMAQLEKRKRSSFKHSASISTNCGGMRIIVGEQRLGVHDVFKRVETSPRPFAYHDGSEAFTFVDCQLAQDIRSFAEAHEAFKTEVGQARAVCFEELTEFFGLKTGEDGQ